MNPRMVTEAQKLASRKRRNTRKALKRKARRHRALEATITAHASVMGEIPFMEGEDALLIQYGTPKQIKQRIAILNSYVHEFDPQNPSKIVMMTNSFESEPVAPTHELIENGDRWSLKRRRDFELW